MHSSSLIPVTTHTTQQRVQVGLDAEMAALLCRAALARAPKIGDEHADYRDAVVVDVSAEPPGNARVLVTVNYAPRAEGAAEAAPRA